MTAYEILLDWSSEDRKSTRLNSSHLRISYAVFCLKKKKNTSELQSPQNLVCRLLLEKKTSHSHLLSLLRLTRCTPRCSLFSCSMLFFFFLKNGAPPKTPLFPPHAVFRF